MHILVTAGNTQVLIDRVRSITNIFTGRTGASIALHCHQHGHDVTLLTSHPDTVAQLQPDFIPAQRWQLQPYVTFDDLHALLQQAITSRQPDVIIHCAAVSDYRSGGIFAPAPETRFDTSALTWQGENEQPQLVNMAAGKVKSNAPELWLRLVRTPKLVDLFRRDWGFRGVLVKFKLEVGLGEAELLQAAESSRQQSQADLLVANTLEEASQWAYLGPQHGHYERIERHDLPARLLQAIESLYRDKSDG